MNLLRRLRELLRDMPETSCSRHHAFMRLAAPPRRAPLVRLAEDYPAAWVSKALRRIFRLEAL